MRERHLRRLSLATVPPPGSEVWISDGPGFIEARVLFTDEDGLVSVVMGDGLIDLHSPHQLWSLS